MKLARVPSLKPLGWAELLLQAESEMAQDLHDLRLSHERLE
jgi:hypothetical protein